MSEVQTETTPASQLQGSTSKEEALEKTFVLNYDREIKFLIQEGDLRPHLAPNGIRKR